MKLYCVTVMDDSSSFFSFEPLGVPEADVLPSRDLCHCNREVRRDRVVPVDQRQEEWAICCIDCRILESQVLVLVVSSFDLVEGISSFTEA